MLQGNEQSGHTTIPGAPFCKFLKDEQVSLSSITCEMLKVLAELIDLDYHRRMFAERLEGDAEGSWRAVSGGDRERVLYRDWNAGAPVTIGAFGEGANDCFADRFTLGSGSRTDESAAGHAESLPRIFNHSQEPGLSRLQGSFSSD